MFIDSRFGKREKRVNKYRTMKMGVLLFTFLILIVNINLIPNFTNPKSNNLKSAQGQWLSPSLLSQFSDNYSSSTGVFVLNDTAYVTDYKDGLEIINVSDPTDVKLLGKYKDDTNRAMDVYVSNNIAYVADMIGGLEIINVSDPNNPTFLGRYSDNYNQAYEIFMRGNYIYVADLGDGLEIIDVRNPKNPVEIGSFNCYCTIGIFIEGDIAYLADWEEGLKIVNISNLGNPVLLGQYSDSSNTARNVWVEGDIAYSLDEGHGLEIINISNPNNPYLVNRLIRNSPISIYIKNGLLFISEWTWGVEYMNMSTPIDPKFINRIGSGSCRASDVYVIDEIAYVADMEDGLEIWDIGLDTDKDNITNAREKKIYFTDSNNPDTDGDGWSDWQEIFIHGTDPIDPNSIPRENRQLAPPIIISFDITLVIIITVITVGLIFIKRKQL